MSLNSLHLIKNWANRTTGNKEERGSCDIGLQLVVSSKDMVGGQGTARGGRARVCGDGDGRVTDEIRRGC
jgi:hypothetical protein